MQKCNSVLWEKCKRKFSLSLTKYVSHLHVEMGMIAQCHFWFEKAGII